MTVKITLKSSFKYLELVIDLPIKTIEPIAGKIQHIQYIRNRIVHNGAEFSYEKNESLEQVVNALSDMILFQEVVVGKTRVLKLFNTEIVMRSYHIMRDLFINLFWQIDKKYGYPILTDRLNILFQNPPGGTIKITDIKSIKAGRQINAEVIPPGGIKYQCKISMTSGKMNKTEVFNQIEDSKEIKRILEEPANVLHWRIDAVFEAFRYHNPAMDYKLMFF